MSRKSDEAVSPATAVEEAIGSHPDPVPPQDVVSGGAAVDDALGSHPDPAAAGGWRPPARRPPG